MIDYITLFKAYSKDSELPGVKEFFRVRSILLQRAAAVLVRMGCGNTAVPTYDAVQERISCMLVQALFNNQCAIPAIPTIFSLPAQYDRWAIAVSVAYLEMYDRDLLAVRWGSHVQEVFASWDGAKTKGGPAENAIIYETIPFKEVRSAELIAIRNSTPPSRWLFLYYPPRLWDLKATRSNEDDGLDCYQQVVELKDLLENR